MASGRLAQLARASRLHREGRGFKSLSAHLDARQSFHILCCAFFIGFLLCRACRFGGGYAGYPRCGKVGFSNNGQVFQRPCNSAGIDS